MGSYILRRLVQGLLILLLATILVFFIMRLMPGDPLLLYMSTQDIGTLTTEQMEALRHQYGLDKTLPEQYISWLGGVLRGDLGKSIYYRMEVISLVKQRMPITINLGIEAFILSSLLGIFFGVICAVRRATWIDTVFTILANLGITVPTFWVGILLIYFFSLKLGLLPTTGYVSPIKDFGASIRHSIMPVFCLSLFSIAALTRQTRSSMLEIVSQDYIRTAWAKGLSEKIIIIRHQLKNALIPVITMLGMQVAMIFGGSVIIETVFNIPGMGRLLTTSVFQHDFPVIQAGTLIMASVIVLSNLLVDISYGWFDPRIRYG